jgi:hypothetical protein
MEILGYLDAGAHESLSPTTSTGITAAIRQPTSGEFNNKTAIAALVTVEDNSARFTVDGTTPTNTSGDSSDTGHLMSAGQNYVIEGSGVPAFRIIDAVSGVASIVKITTFFRR